MSDDNSGSTIELNRRRVLAGLGTIGVASAGAGAGTMALFSDTESTTGNTVQAGTLNLSVAGQDPFAFGNYAIGPIKPGDSGGYTVPLENTGNIDGYLDFVLIGTNSEGDNPESETDTTGSGDLGDLLEMKFEIDGQSTGWQPFNDVFNRVYDIGVPLTGTKNASIDYRLPSSAGNDVQGDKVTVNLYAYLHQKANQTPGTTYDVNAVKSTPGSGTVRVTNELVTIDTSTFDDPASQWVGTENIGFWFGDGSNSVELKYHANSGWSLPAGNNGTGATLADFEFNRSGDQFSVAFDDSTYTQFGLYVEPENQEGNGSEQAVATPNDQMPWNGLYTL